MIREIIKSIREYKKETILTPICVAVEVIMETLIPFVMADLIDKGVYAGDMSVITKIGIELVFFSILSLIFGILSARFSAMAGAGFATNLRQDLYFKVQDFSFRNIDKFSTSSLITRLTTDVSNIQNAFQMIIRIAVRTPLMLFVSLFFALKISPKLSLIFLILIPMLGVGLYLIIRRTFPVLQKVFKTYDRLNNVVEENVSGIRVVKSYVLEDEEINKFTNVSDVIYKNFSKAEKLIALNSPLMQSSIYICILVISYFGAKIIVNTGMEELTTGELMTMFTYSIQILSSLMMLSMVLVMIAMSKSSGERVVEVLDEVPDIVSPKNPVLEVKDGSIRFHNVSFSYVNDENKECLSNINLDIKSGETVGIIGGTGSGKTSLVNLIPRLYDVTDGEVIVGGVNVKDYDLVILRDSVSCVLQKNVLFSGSIADNVRWGNSDASIDEVKSVCRLAQADQFINDFPNGYDTRVEQGGTNLSGGQKQRLCIARALLKNPKILILDDSTSAVDTRTDSLLRKSFRDEIPNVTKIIVAQRISSIEDADKIIVMKDGCVNGFGNHKELLKSNRIYKEVYQSQMKGVGI